jgi:hypothetical protein
VTIKIALTGAHGTGKDTLIRHVEERLVEQFTHQAPWPSEPVVRSGMVKVLQSAQRWVQSTMQTGRHDDRDPKDQDWNQLWGAVRRRFWEEETLAQDPKVILSPRCGIDEAAYQGVWLAKQQGELERKFTLLAGLGRPLDPENGQAGVQTFEFDEASLPPEVRDLMGYTQRSQVVLTILMEQSSYEVQDYWDWVYYKPPRTDVPVEDDGVRPDQEYQALVDRQLQTILEHNTIFQQKVVWLPADVDAAKEFLDGELEHTWAPLIADTNSS